MKKLQDADQENEDRDEDVTQDNQMRRRNDNNGAAGQVERWRRSEGCRREPGLTHCGPPSSVCLRLYGNRLRFDLRLN